ncbi:hypothetical protein ACRYJU_07430 [Alloalcanivorax xenomutans]
MSEPTLKELLASARHIDERLRQQKSTGQKAEPKKPAPKKSTGQKAGE